MTDWQPGDPLFDPFTVSNTHQPMFQLKEEHPGLNSVDAARWTPRTGWINPYVQLGTDG